ncbi:MAG: TIGR03013 family PEP-CTERM/XrtA system glycosyltransferase [Chromatiaceae bacterium]|nr:TIGR03013 family PEP-CTERM/XrtA system glycosyltransferase [Chromatiaceae bacterium]MBP8282340.1 TIGR03013 family PEP-CTERM/XrtA system glycosyltransferase [Chromatiaceae bacterium]MBP8288344.1 TIGR03013 family PEP-CTERM/XrtA system glycosyltransferase [Chromatiaceae bacterium]MBP9602614.1 TIGR03013 family PEP-CTERM/XrtA system glycosyltransferase [Chromatiaceae bacterium]
MYARQLFGYHTSVRFVLLAGFEAALCVLSMYLAVAIRLEEGVAQAQASFGPIGPKAFLFSMVILASLTSMGLYNPGFRENRRALTTRVAVGFTMGLVALSLLFYVFPSMFIGRGVVALTLCISFGGVMVMRTLFFLFVDEEQIKRRVLVLGTGTRAALLDERLRRTSDRRGFKVVGYLRAAHENAAVDESKVLRDQRPLSRLVKDEAIDEIVVAVDERRKNLPVKELLDCKLNGVEVTDLVEFFEKESGRIMIDLLDPSWFIFSDGFKCGPIRGAVKRLFDVFVALVALLLSWPVFVLTAAAILVEGRGRGPILFRQSRVGANGAPFQTLKFRSMRVDAEADGVARWAQSGDSRVTRVGAVIRKLRIDELPQIFNVLQGHMSFVGPRPERPEFVDQLSQSIPFYAERHRVKPGVTGWAQIRYPYGASLEEALQKLQFDLYYVKNYGVLFDLIIIINTVEVVLFRKGAR